MSPSLFRSLLVEPDHTIASGSFVAIVSRFFSTHVIGNSSMVSSHDRRGHIPARYNRSFCFRVRGHLSILQSMHSSSDTTATRGLAWSGGISIFSPKERGL